MSTAIGVVILGIGFFICIVNYYFQKTKYRGQPQVVIKKLNKLNSPTAWISYATVIGIAILVLLAIAYGNMIGGISNMGKLKDQNTGQSNNLQMQGTEEEPLK